MDKNNIFTFKIPINDEKTNKITYFRSNRESSSSSLNSNNSSDNFYNKSYSSSYNSDSDYYDECWAPQEDRNQVVTEFQLRTKLVEGKTFWGFDTAEINIYQCQLRVDLENNVSYTIQLFAKQQHSDKIILTYVNKIIDSQDKKCKYRAKIDFQTQGTVLFKEVIKQGQQFSPEQNPESYSKFFKNSYHYVDYILSKLSDDYQNEARDLSHDFIARKIALTTGGAVVGAGAGTGLCLAAQAAGLAIGGPVGLAVIGGVAAIGGWFLNLFK